MPLPVSMDATWLDGSVQFNGQELRRADSGLFIGDGSSPLGVYGGVVRHNDNSLMVTVNASDLITIQPGPAIIPGNAGVGNGVYRTALGAAETGQLAARNATNPRMDRVIFRVLDTSVVGSHGAYTGRIEVLTGAPNATPVNGMVALPTLAIELARITVPATGGGVATVDSSFRTYAAAIGGTLPVATSARLPASSAKWTDAVALDTGKRYRFENGAWVNQDDPTSAAIATDVNVSQVGAGCTASKVGKMVSLNLELQPNINWNTTWALCTVPVGYRPLLSRVSFVLATANSVPYTLYVNSATGEIKMHQSINANIQILGSVSYVAP